MANQDHQKQIFISYCRKHDWFFANHIAGLVEDLGYTVWIDIRQLNGGAEWRKEIEQNIRKSDAVIVILSPDAQKSEYVTFEWSFALGANLEIVPIIYRNIRNVPPPIADREYIEFYEWRHEQFAKDKLEKTLHGLVTETTRQEVAPAYVNGLTQDIENENADYRRSAAIILGHIRASKSVPKLIEATHDPSIEVRIAAIQALTEFGPHEIIANALIDIIDDEVWEVRQEVYRALTLVGAPCVARLLDIIQGDETTHMRDGRVVGRINAILTLSRILLANPHPKAITVMMKALSDPDPDIRLVAAETLGKWRTTRAVKALINRLDDKAEGFDGRISNSETIKTPIDEIAAVALVQIGTRRALEAVGLWYESGASEGFKERYPIIIEPLGEAQGNEE